MKGIAFNAGQPIAPFRAPRILLVVTGRRSASASASPSRGKRTGGVPISRGHIYWILSNPIYVGRLRHKGQIRDGLHPAHRWLDELLVDPTQTIESLAIREGKSERSIRMTLSLAFMSPALAEAAMEGRLPRGFCIKRLTDLPMLWSRAMGRHRTAGAGSGSSRTPLIHPARVRQYGERYLWFESISLRHELSILYYMCI